MTVDLEAIAQRQRCDLSALRVALPLIEQGYEPPFLTRYRRDEIGNVSERALWELVSALRTERQLETRREELRGKYREGQLEDPALWDSIAEAKTPRQLDRIARRIRTESGPSPPASRLATRLLNPQPGDPASLAELSATVVGAEQAQAAIDGLDQVLGQCLTADARVLQAATQWMDKHVQLHIIEVHDPHEGSQDAAGEESGDSGTNKPPRSAKHGDAAGGDAGQTAPPQPQPDNAVAQGEATGRDAARGGETGSPDAGVGDAVVTEPVATAADSQTATPDAAEAPAAEAADSATVKDAAAAATGADGTSEATPAEPASAETDSAAPKSAAPEASAPETSAPETSAPEASAPETSGQQADGDESATAAHASPSSRSQALSPAGENTAAAETTQAGSQTAPDASAAADGSSVQSSAAKPTAEKSKPDDNGFDATGSGVKGSDGKGSGAKGKAKSKGGRKKISPRQRRRKWLVSVLQPLKGKSLPKAKLTAFQVVMLGRALRSQVVQCGFKYNAGDFVRHLAKVAGGLNAQASQQLSDVVIRNEAAIREALEAAWWDDLIDRAARRLISVATESLRRQLHREPLEARNILAIDAVGPRTAAVAIVGVDGRVLHTEDVACQLTKAVRAQLVTRLGELVHQHHVDLIVLSNGPARRGCMVALSELLSQSEGTGLRWTLAERAGAEIYANGPEGNRELRSVPRRFRAAVWLSQSVRSPARAMAKVDVSRLRLGSYQRELADKQLAAALEDVVTSGVSQIGVDTNGADRGWLASLPGVDDAVAEAIDRNRRQSLFDSRQAVLDLEAWPDVVSQRQAAGFLRVFGSEQPLDGTAIHPDDYPLAEKLMARLEIPAPPAVPPGYEPPDYTAEAVPALTPEPAAEGPKFTEVKIAQVDESEPFGVTPAADETVEETTQESTDGSGGTEAAEAPKDQSERGQSPTDDVGEAASENTAVGGDTTASTDSTASTDTAAEAQSSEGTPAEDAASESAGEAGAGDGDAATELAETQSSASQPAPPEAIEPYSHPLPDGEKIARVVKEWQVGAHRVRHIVRSLCQPFGDAGFDDHTPAATMTGVPKLGDLKPGDKVCGVVVGIAGFGVFVELGPECSGLIHVSRLSEDFVEDLNEFVQIGDVVTAWVIEVDHKRRRVSLSGISPERHAQLREQRGQRREARRARGDRGGAGAGGGGRGARGGGERSQRGGQGGRGGGRPERSGAGGGGRSGGGRSGGGRSGGGRARGGGGRGGGKAPKSYTTVSRSDAPETPINEAKRAGDEPLRSFGELMQFFKEPKQDKAEPGDAKTPPATAESSPGETVPTPEGSAGPAAGTPPAPAADRGNEQPGAAPAADEGSGAGKDAQKRREESMHVEAGRGAAGEEQHGGEQTS